MRFALLPWLFWFCLDFPAILRVTNMYSYESPCQSTSILLYARCLRHLLTVMIVSSLVWFHQALRWPSSYTVHRYPTSSACWYSSRWTYPHTRDTPSCDPLQTHHPNPLAWYWSTQLALLAVLTLLRFCLVFGGLGTGYLALFIYADPGSSIDICSACEVDIPAPPPFAMDDDAPW
jgi:hypothetical protein